jgi:hypothetical protein
MRFTTATALVALFLGTVAAVPPAAAGMQLLTPEEYLDTPVKLESYQTFRVEKGGMGKLFGALQSKSAEEWQWGAPGGYRIVGRALGQRMAQHVKGKTL